MESINQINVVNDDSVSITDLVAKQLAGFSVLRSAHVGNLSPYNLTIAEAGIPLLSVDHTVTGADTNYFPELELSRADVQKVANLGKIVSRAATYGGVHLDQKHLEAVSFAVPGSQVFTNTEYLQSNEAIAGEIVGIALDESPQLFTRLATPEGNAIKRPRVDSMVSHVGVMQLNDDPKAAKESAFVYSKFEGALISLDEMSDEEDYATFDPVQTIIETNFIANKCFIPDNYVLDNANKLTMPVKLIQGRYDMVCPSSTAYELHKVLPNSELFWTVAGHSGSDRANLDLTKALLLG